jgi:hypothetical protein
MNDKVFTLSNGYVASFKPFCSRGAWKEIQKRTLKGMKAKGNAANAQEIDADLAQVTINMAEAADYKVLAMLTSLKDEEGKVVKVDEKYLQDMPNDLFEELEGHVNSILEPKSVKKD